MKPYYEAGGVQLWHGNCRDVLPTLDAVDLCLTDPPYAHEHMDGGGFASARRFYREGAVKDMSSFVLDDFGGLLLKAAPMLIAFHSRDLITDYGQLARESQRKYDLHFWYKTNAIPFTANTWKSDVEYIALIWEKKPGWLQMHQSLCSKVWITALDRGEHPASKPVALMRKYIEVLDAQTILDPFCGSGTTLVAAKTLGGKAIGIELEEKWCEVTARRLERTEYKPPLDLWPAVKGKQARAAL